MGGVCFGAGLGITLFGIMYMFIHDGLVHRRFPVRPSPPIYASCCARLKRAAHPCRGICSVLHEACLNEPLF